MPSTSYPNFEFSQLRQKEHWTRIDQFNGDLDAFSRFVSDANNSSYQRFGPYAMNQVKAIRPEVESKAGNSRGPGAFVIYLDQGDGQFFVSLSKKFDDVTYVWAAWQSEEARRAHEPALDGPGCLKRLGVLALGDRQGVALRFTEQDDNAFMWKASSVHPLQVLENAYQRIVRKAGNQADADPVQAQSETLARYFMQDAGEPACFAYKPGGPPDGTQLSAVRMNHLIDTFYLFRLLVRYQAESQQPVSEDLRVALSGDLTKLLHNGDRSKMGWLTAWLTKKIAELGDKIEKLNSRGERRAIFFVKGGRALNFFLGTPEKGENDWDTQVVIDPRLPAEKWYQCFSEVHDVLLTTLQTFKAEFTQLVKDNAPAFGEYLKSKAGPEAGDDEEPDENEISDGHSRAEHASCKAELIDIGIPRRDSASALEEWTHLSADGALLKKDGVIYPHREYYLNEYLMMIREACTPNADIKKAPKRITRFGLILASDHPGGPSPAETKRLEALPKTGAILANIDRKEKKELFRIVFAQFVEAYNLLQDRELAARFDEKSAAMLQNPPSLSAGLAALLDDAQKSVAGDVFLAHTLSEYMREHWKRRNEFFEGKREFFVNFVRDLAQRTNQRLQGIGAQFAVAGGYAARLQADHLRVKPEGLEPIRRILIKLQCPQGRNEVEVLDAVRDAITKAAAESGKLTVDGTDVPSAKHKSVRLFWAEPAPIGDFTYRPLVMKIRGAAQTGSQLPVLASIDGMPVLDLRYVVADYLRKTSKIDEWGSRRILASATAATSEMLSQFDFESDNND